MRSRVLLFASALAACAPGAGATRDTASGAVDRTTDVDAIRSAVDARLRLYLDALLKGDATSAASIYTDDAVSNVPNAEPIRGRTAIEKHHADWLASTTFAEAIGSTVEVIPAGDTLAVEVGTYEWTVTPKGRSRKRESGRYMNLWRRDREGAWKVWREVRSAESR